MIRLGLESIKRLCEQLNNPQDNVRFIHIAGTNGKGSTGTMISVILHYAKLRVGHYSSPAVFSREEVIRINNRPISKKNYDIYLDKVNKASEQLVLNGYDEPTEFEKECALAFLYFNDQKVDICVLECGMGGLLDATNIINNTSVSVFTPISMDHTDYLGNSIEAIAENKAGIIKENCIVVTAPQQEAVFKVLRDRSAEKNSKLEISPNLKIGKSLLPVKGINQIQNAQVAIAAAKCIVDIDETACIKALKNVKMPGRFEKISDKPVIYIDGGHNISAAYSLKENIESYLKNKKIILVTGMLFNKDHDGVMKIIAPMCDVILTISTMGDRGYSAEDLSRDILPYNNNVSAIGGIEEALELACILAKTGSAVVVFGSLSFLKDVKKWNDLRK